MYIKQEKLNNGLDGFIKIRLNSNDEFVGYKQEIDNLTKFKSIDLVNPVNDTEKLKFKLDPVISMSTLSFYFSGATSFLSAGFTQNEIDIGAKNVRNSFFILDYYDTYDQNTQTKLFKSYLTKIGKEPVYNVSSNTNNQLYYWYVPLSYIESVTGSTKLGYVKFSFYNAKTGSITIFYNSNNSGLTTPEKYYFKSELNFNDRTWKFTDVNVTAIEQRYVGLYNYNTKVDNTYDKYELSIQVFPTGNTYDYKVNRYKLIK